MLAGLELEPSPEHDLAAEVGAEASGHVDRRPRAVVEVGVDRDAAAPIVHRSRPPLAVELHAGSVPMGSGSIGP